MGRWKENEFALLSNGRKQILYRKRKFEGFLVVPLSTWLFFVCSTCSLFGGLRKTLFCSLTFLFKCVSPILSKCMVRVLSSSWPAVFMPLLSWSLHNPEDYFFFPQQNFFANLIEKAVVRDRLVGWRGDVEKVRPGSSFCIQTGDGGSLRNC